jgi:hypothetical protein
MRAHAQLDGDPDALRGFLGLSDIANEDRGELVTSDPGRHVFPAQGSYQRSRDFPQHAVAGSVSQSVVDTFEAVKVEIEKSEAITVSFLARNRPFERVDERSPVPIR